jgi:hypothetical protein
MLPGCDFPGDRTARKEGNQQRPGLKTEHRKIQDEVADLKICRKCKRHPVRRKKNQFGAVGIKEKWHARTAKKTEVALRSKISRRWTRKTLALIGRTKTENRAETLRRETSLEWEQETGCAAVSGKIQTSTGSDRRA